MRGDDAPTDEWLDELRKEKPRMREAQQRLQDALIRDLGGAERLTTQQLMLCRLLAKDYFQIEAADLFIETLPNFGIRKASKEHHPIVIERNKLEDSVTRRLATLGIERPREEERTLEAHLASKYGVSPLDRVLNDVPLTFYEGE